VKKRLFAILLALVLMVSLVSVLAVACEEEGTDTTGEGTETTVGEAKTLTIGGIAFLTGPAAAGGMACKTGWELAVAKVNADGGLKIGDDTYMVNLVVEDDAMSIDQASTAAQKLIQQDGATFMVGPLIDAFKNVIQPICAEAGVLLATSDTCNASAKIEYEGNTDVSPDKDLYIRAHWANDEVMPYLFDYLTANYPDAKKIAVCGVTEACTVGIYNWLETKLPEVGLERVGELEQMAPDTADYNPPVQRILSANPDAILVAVSTPTTWGFVTKAAREQGFTGPVLCATHLDVEFADRIAGGGNTDMFGAGVCLSDIAALSADMQAAHEAYAAEGYPAADEIADVYLVGYNGMWVLLQAIQAAQSVEPRDVFENYQTLTTKGDLKTLWGDAFVAGIESTGINAVLNEPYWINAIGAEPGVAKNVQYIEMVECP